MLPRIPELYLLQIHHATILPLEPKVSSSSFQVYVKTVTFCSLYLPPSLKWNKADIEDLLNQLPPPVVLMGDFNAHSRYWGCPKDDSKGKLISDLLLQCNLSLLKRWLSHIFAPRLRISICYRPQHL